MFVMKRERSPLCSGGFVLREGRLMEVRDTIEKDAREEEKIHSIVSAYTQSPEASRPRGDTTAVLSVVKSPL